MVAKWFVLIDGTERGPLDDKQLRRLASAGQLRPIDSVRAGASEWVLAKNVKGLFPPPSSSPSKLVTEAKAVVTTMARPVQTESKPAVAQPDSNGSSEASYSARRPKRWPIAVGVGLLLLGLIGSQTRNSDLASVGSNHAPNSVSFDIQGLKIGEKKDSSAANVVLFDASWISSTSALRQCQKQIVIGPSQITTFFSFEANVLISVSLHYKSEMYEQVVNAYTAKFGVPPHEVEEELMTTRAGVDFTNQVATWQTDSGPFIIRRYGDSVDWGYAVLYSPAFAAYTEKESRAKAEHLGGQL